MSSDELVRSVGDTTMRGNNGHISHKLVQGHSLSWPFPSFSFLFYNNEVSFLEMETLKMVVKVMMWV